MVEERIGLIIADDSNIVIECFRNWIDDSPKIRLIGVVHKTDELLSLIDIGRKRHYPEQLPLVTEAGKDSN